MKNKVLIFLHALIFLASVVVFSMHQLHDNKTNNDVVAIIISFLCAESSVKSIKSLYKKRNK